jgi:hypothetical protein
VVVSLELLGSLGPMVPALVPMLAPETESPSSTNPGEVKIMFQVTQIGIPHPSESTTKRGAEPGHFKGGHPPPCTVACVLS